GSFGFVVFRPRVDSSLEVTPQILAGDRELVPWPARLELDDLHRRIPAAVAADITLGLGERAQADNEPQRTSGLGRHLCDDEGVPGTTITPPRERLDRGEGTGLGRPWNVIVLNDNHNTFQGVAFAISSVIPGVSYDAGLRLADRIHNAGQAI